MAKQKVAVLVGRFQPMHLGHAHVLDSAFKKYDAVIILIGSANQARDPKNPFTAEERRRMICAYLTEKNHSNYTIDPLRNFPYNDALWLQNVQKLVDENIFALTVRGHLNARENVEISIIGADRDSSTWYVHAFPQYELDLSQPVPAGQNLNATALRDRLFNGDLSSDSWDDVPSTTLAFLTDFVTSQYEVFKSLKDEYEFIKTTKQQYSGLKYPPIFSTTDAIVIQSGHVLVIERAALPGKGLLALPGGYLQSNLSLLDNMIKELLEETGILLADGKRAKEITENILRSSIKAKEQFDDPSRSLRGRIVTTAYLVQLDDTKPLPKVYGMNAPLEETGGKLIPETVRVRWMPINEAMAAAELWFEDHLHILAWGISHCS